MSMTPHKNDSLATVKDAESEVIARYDEVNLMLDSLSLVHENMTQHWDRAVVAFNACSTDEFTVANMLKLIEDRPEDLSNDDQPSRPDYDVKELRMYYDCYSKYAQSYKKLIGSHTEKVHELVRALSTWEELVASQGTISYLIDPRVAKAIEEYRSLVSEYQRTGMFPRRPRYE